MFYGPFKLVLVVKKRYKMVEDIIAFHAHFCSESLKFRKFHEFTIIGLQI